MSAIAMLEQRFAQAGHSGRIIAPCTHNPPLQLEEFGCGQHHSQRKHGDHRFSDSAHREGSQSLQLQLFETPAIRAGRSEFLIFLEIKVIG